MASSGTSAVSPPKGFAGLQQLASRVDIQQLAALSLAGSPDAPQTTSTPNNAPPAGAYQAPPKAPSTPPVIKLLLSVGALALMVAFCTHQGTSTTSSTTSAAAPPASTYSSQPAPDQTSTTQPPLAQTDIPSQASAYADESKPMVGSENLLSEGEIRYCLSEAVRIDTAKAAVDQANSDQIQTFNTLVADFNSRCGNYRYRQSDYDRAQAAVAEDKTRLEREGEAKIQ